MVGRRVGSSDCLFRIFAVGGLIEGGSGPNDAMKKASPSASVERLLEFCNMLFITFTPERHWIFV